MATDSLHLNAFALEASAGSAMAVGCVHTLTLHNDPCSAQWQAFGGRAVLGQTVASQADRRAAAQPGGLTMTFKALVSA